MPAQNYKRIFIISAISILCVALLFIYKFETPDAKINANIKIALPAFQSSGLVLLADKKGFFKEEGLNVDLIYKATGKLCLDLVIKKEAQYAVVYETPVVRAVLDGNDIAILTELHRSEGNTAIVYRADRNIYVAADLLGKKIAFVPVTNADYLLNLFLKSNLIPLSNLQKSYSTIENVLADLKTGVVDAAVLWEPYVSEAMAHDKSLFFRLQSSYYSEFSTVAALKSEITEGDKTTLSIIRALYKASEFFQKEPGTSKKIIDSVLLDRGVRVSSEAWKQLNLQIGLSSTLLTMLNEEANYYRVGMGKKEYVDMKPLLTPSFLNKVDPASVTFE